MITYSIEDNTNTTIDSSFNFVNLVEDNPITRLSYEYNNKFINKIKEIFTEEQQHIFVSSFYCYLNYHSTNDFVIDLDDIWKWIGFSTKQKAKILLEENFKIDKDYKRLLNPRVKQYKDTRGGHNKQTILLNIRTFKLFCLKAGTQKANDIHEYYIKLEETLQDVINEESNELKLQLENTKNQLEENSKKQKSERELLREKTLLEQFPNNVECVYYGSISNTNQQNEKLIKFGQTNNLNRRVMNHKKTFEDFRLVNAFRVENKQLIENEIKQHEYLKKFRRNITINNVNHVEILALNGLNITELDKYINNIISSNEFTVDNFKKLLEENNNLKEENILLKELNEKITIENKKLMRNKIKNFADDIYEKKENENKIMDKNIIEEVIEEMDVTALFKKIIRNKDGFFHIEGKKYKILTGTREQVWNETAYRTTGSLTKDKLIVNKYGKIVSKTKFLLEKQNNRLEDYNIKRQAKIDNYNNAN